jgi:hypothetical protein
MRGLWGLVALIGCWLVTASAMSEPAQTPSTAVVVIPQTAGTQPTENGTQASPKAPASVAADLDQIVCKNSPPPVGSRLGGGRECHSVREWNEQMHEVQQGTRRMESVGLNGNCVSDPGLCKPVR